MSNPQINPRITVRTERYMGDHGEYVEVAIPTIPGETVEELLTRVGDLFPDQMQSRAEDGWRPMRVTDHIIIRQEVTR